MIKKVTFEKNNCLIHTILLVINRLLLLLLLLLFAIAFIQDIG